MMAGNLVTIVRDGHLINIDEADLRKNDTVVLQTADIVPADLKLIEANGLEVDEFDITGEIMPVVKNVEEDDVMLYAGCRVIKGTGKGVVVTIGEETEYGKALKQDWEQEMPYQFRLIEKKYLAPIPLLLLAFLLQAEQSNHIFVLAIFYFILSVAILLLQNEEFHKQFLVSNELKKLERLDIQIRDTRVLEQIGNMDILCFDKTGVPTTRRMEVGNICFGDGTLISDSSSTIDRDTLRIIDTACALCNDVRFFEKHDQANPIDKALISFAQKNGMDVRQLLSRSKRIYDQPFDSEYRYMACGFQLDGKEIYFAKGDPQIIVGMCNSYMTAAGERTKTDPEFWHLNRLNLEAVSQNGNTAIALAYSDESPTDYTYLCLLQLENPLQVGVCEMIKDITKKGIRSTLLTGDRAETAVSVTEASGIASNSKAVLTGRTLDRMESSEIVKQSAYCSVFARLLPSQKGSLIRLLQQGGHCVGMVGDGINDGVALRAADVSISFVENGSPVARRLANILIKKISDLPKLLESAYQIKKRIGQLRVARILVMAASLIGISMGFYHAAFWKIKNMESKNSQENQLRQYTLAKQQISDLVRESKQIMDDRKDEAQTERCQNLLVKLAEDRFNLAVVGQFKRGKSSVMNAIIGRNLLPTGLLPLTSAITTLCYGPQEKIILKRTGWVIEQEIELKELPDYVTEQGNPGNEKGVIEARIEMPTPFLRRGLYFVDTPGIGSTRTANTATTYNFLPQADAVIFVTSVESPLSESEENFLRDIQGYVRRLFVVANKIDLLSPQEQDQVLSYIQSGLSNPEGSNVQMYPLSARNALQAKLGDNAQALDVSGLPTFERALEKFLAEEKANVLLVAVLDDLASIRNWQSGDLCSRKFRHGTRADCHFARTHGYGLREDSRLDSRFHA